jgi:Lysyl oxidase
LRRAALQTLLLGYVLATLAAPSLAAAVDRPPNPCLDPERRARLNCPDLEMSRPYGLALDRAVWPGHVVLRAGNSINSVGRGPAELFGIRDSRYGMRARQRIYRRGGGRVGIATGARLFFKAIPGQPNYWKFLHAARFALWRLDGRGERTRRVRRGPKVSYCLRDLERTHPKLPRSPARMVYAACNTSSATQKVTLGTSVGWSDVYPPSYHEQWIDVTGLRGCFHFVHTADPFDGIYESNERNNSAYVTVRLPFTPGPQACPGRKASGPRYYPDGPDEKYDYGY